MNHSVDITLSLPADVTVRWMTYDPENAVAFEALLSPEERARVSTFAYAGRRRSFLLGRVAARTLLAERLGLDPCRVPLRVAEDGCVDVEGTSMLLSISHTDNHAVAAVAERCIGVDLERIAPRHPNLPRFLLHPDEYATFEALPFDRARAVMLYWTLKEAALKALRTGFRLSPKKLHLELNLPAQTARGHLVGRPPIHLRFEERGAYYLAVAFEE